MPTICEIKMQLKELGVKGISGKNKAELYEMLLNARPPLVVPKKRERKPVLSAKERSMAELEALFEKVKEKARSGLSYNELVDFWNTNISPKLDLYGAEYLSSGEASEIAEERWDEVKELYKEHSVEYKEGAEKREKAEKAKWEKSTSPPIIPKKIRENMYNQLNIKYKSIKTKLGTGYEINDMFIKIRRIQQNEDLWGNYQTPTAQLAYNILGDLKDWISENGINVNDEFVLPEESWYKFLKANEPSEKKRKN
jgi:hypothetical protein